MKVLHVISGDLWAGAEVQAYTLLASLKREPDVQVAAALLNDGQLAGRLREHGIPVTLLPESRLGAWQIVRGLRQVMREWRADIVHTHRFKENVLGAIANALARNVPSVRTVHGSSEGAQSRRLDKQLVRSVDRFCCRHVQKKVIAVSRDLSQKLADDLRTGNIVVIENGIDIEAARAQVRPVEFRIPGDSTRHVGIVGRLVPVKRVDLFLRMAALLLQRDSAQRWHFHVFGDGPLRTSLVSQAESMRIEQNVTFHGHRQDVVACIAALDTLVMCSDHEGLPMTLLEALAVATPVVAHSVGGMVSVLSDPSTGTLVENHDPAAYAAAVTEWASRGRGPREPAVLLEHSASANARSTKMLYQTLLRGSST
jgi:L-malate glycosyltransferase